MVFIFEEFTNPDVLRRERRNRRIIIGAVLTALVGSFLYWQFKNYPEERAVSRFLVTLQRHPERKRDPTTDEHR